MNFDGAYIDIAYVNGIVLTVDARDHVACAVGVKKNRIVFVGTTEQVMSLADSRTEIIDLKGRTLCPGFIDSHFHPILAGLIGTEPQDAMRDVFYPNCKSLAQLLGIIKQMAEERKKGEWISLMGYEPLLFPEKRHPTLEELDAVAPQHPVHCMHQGGHICMYNSKALAYLGIATPQDAEKYPKGEVEVVNGKLTGLVRGNTHFFLWSKVGYTQEQQSRAAMKSYERAIRAGVTSIHDCGELDAPSYHIMQKLCRNRQFKIRTYMMLHSIFGKKCSKEDNCKFIELGLMSGLGDAYFKIGGSKFMIDGGSGAPSCATRQPYSHNPHLPRERGWEREEVAEYIAYIHDAECQATAHAIGDLAVEFMVEGYEKAFARRARPDARHRIEHCALVDEDLIQRMAAMNICPTLNSGMLTTIGANYTYFYGERMKYMVALRSMLDAGIKVSLASDAPSGPIGGIPLMDGAVNRIDRVNKQVLDQTQRISVKEALRCCTYYGAYASFEETIKGSIEAGKLADLVVLSENILEIPREELNRVKVDITMIDGEIVFSRK